MVGTRREEDAIPRQHQAGQGKAKDKIDGVVALIMATGRSEPARRGTAVLPRNGTSPDRMSEEKTHPQSAKLGMAGPVGLLGLGLLSYGRGAPIRRRASSSPGCCSCSPWLFLG
jgi:hypothetical protein